MFKRPIEITYDQAVEYLNQIVAGVNPGYAYDRGDATLCQYFEKDGEPSCIIGHLLAKYGVAAKDLGRFNANTVGVAFEHLVHQGVISPVDGRTASMLRGIQSKQDWGVPWGDAVKTVIAEQYTLMS